MPGTGIVILDKDGGRAVELDSQGNLPMYMISGDSRTFAKESLALHRYGAAGTGYYLNVNDNVVPALGSGVDLSRYSNAVVSCVTSGDEVSWDIVPLYGNSAFDNYTSGDKIDINGSMTKTITVAGYSDVYILCRNLGGINPGIKVWIAGYNT